MSIPDPMPERGPDGAPPNSGSHPSSPKPGVQPSPSAKQGAAAGPLPDRAGEATTPPAESASNRPTISTVATDSTPVIPRLEIPGYEIVREIGRGGMGIVFQARQVKLDRMVALKMIRGYLDVDSMERERFLREAQALARMQHPNIVQVFDVGEHNSQPYFASELVSGGNLAGYISGQPQPARLAARLIQTLAGAVQHAHEQGIVHRDLKPANVLLAPLRSRVPGSSGQGDSGSLGLLGTPKITDFGLAKQLGGGSGQTRSGAILGTPSYMAPEQAEGAVHEVGPAADIYSLGAILYELLTGVPPFRGETALDTLYQVVNRSPRPPSELQPTVPRELEAICLRCLEKVPAARYPTAAALADDLERYLAANPVESTPPGGLSAALHRSWRRVPRRYQIAAGTFAGASLIIGLLVLYSLRSGRPERSWNATFSAVTARLNATTFIKDNWQAIQDYSQVETDIRALIASASLTERPEAQLLLPRLYLARGFRWRQLREYGRAGADIHAAQGKLDELLAAQPEVPAARQLVAEVHHAQGELHQTQQQRREAIAAFTQAIAVRQKLYEADPGNRRTIRDLARDHGFLGDTQLELGLFDQAKKSYDLAEELRRKLIEITRNDPTPDENREAQLQLARSYGNSAFFEAWTGRPQEALPFMQQQRELLERLITAGPIPAEFRTDLAGNLIQTADLHLATTSPPPESVLLLLTRAEGMYTALASENVELAKDPEVRQSLAAIQENLAAYYLERRPPNPTEARRLLESARQTLETLIETRSEPADLVRLSKVYSLLSGQEEAPAKGNDDLARAALYLERAVRLGYRDFAQLDRDPALRALFRARADLKAELKKIAGETT
jgi:serine/threonine protein kinase/tetratricopeptide (TPR) repeat protein